LTKSKFLLIFVIAFLKNKMANSTRRGRTESNQPSASKRTFDFYFIEPALQRLSTFLELEERLSLQKLKPILWFFCMVLAYIFLQHRYDGMIRSHDKAENQLQEARATYIWHKSKYLHQSKQSELSKTLEPFGFEKNGNPPLKIAVE
jgi:hypothetical protein